MYDWSHCIWNFVFCSVLQGRHTAAARGAEHLWALFRGADRLATSIRRSSCLPAARTEERNSIRDLFYRPQPVRKCQNFVGGREAGNSECWFRLVARAPRDIERQPFRDDARNLCPVERSSGRAVYGSIAGKTSYQYWICRTLLRQPKSLP